MHRQHKRFLSFLLALVLSLSCLSTTAAAELFEPDVPPDLSSLTETETDALPSTTPNSAESDTPPEANDPTDADTSTEVSETPETPDSTNPEEPAPDMSPEAPETSETPTPETSSEVTDPVVTDEPSADPEPNITDDSEDSNPSPADNSAVWMDEAGLVYDQNLIDYSARPFSVRNTTYPTYQEVYNSIMALKSKYPEGMPFTNFTPYTMENPYNWKGGPVKGANGGVGCAGFAFEASDNAFGDIPARVYDRGEFTFADIKVGDILRINNAHFVIVIQKAPGGVIVTEANYNKTVHWGRAISAAEVENSLFIVSRYPKNFTPSDADEANNVVDQGSVDNISWALSQGGTLTISGSGDMPNFSNANPSPWYQYNDQITSIVVERGISSIGNYALSGAHAISISLPNSITVIGDDAFRSCINLTSTTIPEGVTTINQRAFYGCTALKNIDFPASTIYVGDGAFASCSSLLRVRFVSGDSDVYLGNDIFTQCYYLNTVILPQKITRIPNGLFASCKSLASLYIPASVTNLGLDEDGYGDGPFKASGIVLIEFGGSEEAWRKMLNSTIEATLGEGQMAGKPAATIKFNVAYDDPFAADPNDPGDLVYPCQNGHTGEKDENGNCTVCGKPFDSEPPAEEDPCKNGHIGEKDENGNCTVCGKPMETTPPDNPDQPSTPENPDTPNNPDNPDVDPSEHTHAWANEWAYNSTSHWHECTANGCPISNNSAKSDYANHIYGDWIVDVAATVGQAGSRHRDCTICAQRETASIPALTIPSRPNPTPLPPSSSSNRPSNSTTNNSTSKPSNDNSNTNTVKDEITSTVSTGTSGEPVTTVRIPASVIETFQMGNQPITLPISAVSATRSLATAPAIVIHTDDSSPARVTIPVITPTSGTVAVVVNSDGSTEVIKTSVPTTSGLLATLPSDVTVKVIDNSKSFSDVPTTSWFTEAVTFVTARELFAGTTATDFSPEAPMTRAMLMTVLARLDGVDTSGGESWYSAGMNWATARNISDGSNPDGNITREQLVTMLWRYLGSPTPAGTISDYTDTDQINSYAKDAMCWATETNLINGIGDGRLDPQGQATRAQVSQILKNLIENLHATSV